MIKVLVVNNKFNKNLFFNINKGISGFWFCFYIKIKGFVCFGITSKVDSDYFIKFDVYWGFVDKDEVFF